MDRRSLLAAGAGVGLLAVAGCVDSLVPGRVTTTGATGVLHAVDEFFLDDGASSLDGPGYTAALLRTREDAERRWHGPDGDPVTEYVRRVDWDREFLLVLEARTPRHRVRSISPLPGTERQTSLSGLRCDVELTHWTGPVPDDAGNEVVFTLAVKFERERTAPPSHARVDFYAPGESEATVTVRTR